MARGPGALKRIKEATRRDHQRSKAARKEERRRVSEDRRRDLQPGQDPDLAGITPGPQPAERG